MKCSVVVAMLLALAGLSAAKVLPACEVWRTLLPPVGQGILDNDLAGLRVRSCTQGHAIQGQGSHTQPDSAGWIGPAMRETAPQCSGHIAR